MPQFGEVRVDFITFTTGVSPSEANVTIPVSGLVKNPTFSGDITVTGTISGATITGDAGQFTTLTAGTVTGTTGNFTTVTTTTANVTSGIFASGTAAAPSVSVGTTDNGIYSPAVNQIAIATSGTHQVRVNADGNVGIGTVAPTQRLVVSDTNTTVASFDTNQTTTRLRLRTGLSSDVYVGAVDTNSFFVNTAGTERLRVDNSGNVGIGTSTPDTKLHVYSSNITQSWSDNSADLIKLEGAVEGINFVTSSTGFLAFSDADARARGVIEYLHSSDSMQFDTAGSERMRIDSSGKVGIGTNNPGQKLVVSEGGAQGLEFNPFTSDRFILAGYNRSTSQYIQLEYEGSNHIFKSGTSEKMRINSSGNVGIGTGSPTNKLSVVSTTGSVGANITASGNAYLILDSSVGGTSGNQISFIDFKDNGVLQANISVNEAVSGQPLELNSATSNNVVLAAGGGNVGIGTNSPSATLDVNGSLSKNSGSFRIDHPLPALTETHHLVHSFVEAPDASNLYAGMVDLVDGRATVNIDTAHRMTEGTFEALNTVQSWSSSNESGYAPVKSSLSGNILTIQCQDATSNDTVYYEVRGIRKDKHMIETEWTDENGRVITEPLKQPLTDAGL